MFLFQGFGGPGTTNSLGKAFFESVTSPLSGPVPVGADGSMGGAAARQALYHLRVRRTFADKKRGALDAMAFTAKVGVTTLLDQVLLAIGFGPRDPQPGHFLAQLEHFRMYDGWLAVHADGNDFVRLQTNFLHNQGYNADLGGLENQLPALRERLKNQFPFFGDELFRTGGIGEWAAPFAGPSNPDGYAVWYEAQRLVAQAGWRNENSPRNEAAVQQVVETYEVMDAEFGITDLRWGAQHVEGSTEAQILRFKDLNCGVSMSGFTWNGATPGPTPTGPNFPMIVGTGIPAALHQDGVHIAPHNAWFAMHYATTGLNHRGEPVNADWQITREQAVHAYTQAAAWFLNRENDL
ncbi:MAG: amidohydrolase family protein, partial [Acidimicrobiia bacterium]|nr:amidohydrolase family protein [Acidimicrobiia bacterium]